MGLNGLKNEIVYPIFIECIPYVSDAFWKGIFEDLAFGKTPYGVYISKDFLCCSYKNKDFSYKIEPKNPKELYHDIHNLLINRAGILSTGDKNKKKLEFIRAENTIKDNRNLWSDIKKKSVKDFLIELYVVNMKKQYNLTLQKARKLLSLIMIAFVFKTLTNKDILYEDCEIKHIEGIDFTNGDFHFTKDIYGINSVELTPEIIIEKRVMSESWPKYYNSLTPKALKQRLV